MRTVKALLSLLILITFSANAQTYCETFNKISHPGTWYITNLTLGDIDNTSANPSEFTHYSGVSTQLTQGTTYTGSINYTIPANQSHRLKIWIDYNDNGTLDDSGEEIFNPGQISGSAATEFSQDFTFTVPTTNINNGDTRLRVMLTRANYPACGNNSGTSGEVEDYDIEIRPTPVAPTAVCQDLSIELDIFGDAVITASQINNGSSDDYDAVGDLTLSIDQTEFDCDNLGANTVTLTVTDLDGLTDTCTATVNVSTYTGAFDVPAFNVIEEYCGYTVATPVLDYQCATTITGTTTDVTTFDTPGTYSIIWSFDNGGTVETETQTVIITNPTTPTALTVSNIDEEDADLSWSSTDAPPFKVRYKESTESVWNVIKNIATTSTSLSGLKNNIQYDVQVATDADCATYTSTVNFTTLELTYCTPAAINNNTNYYINSIELNDIDTQYTSGSNGEYAFDSSLSTIIALGESLTGSITFNKANHQEGYFNIWVDFNSDGDYDDTGEYVFTSNNTTTPLTSVIENISIPVPLTASTGKTRIRLSSSVNLPDSPCLFGNGAGAVLEFELDIRSNATPPTAVCQDLNIQLDISGNATITATQLDGGSTDDFDNSEDLILSIDKTDFNCDDFGDNDVILTVTDSDGLSSTCTANVNVSTYSGSFTAPTLETVNAYCEYTATAPIFNYQCNTTITGTTSDTTIFNTDGTYTIDWSFDNGTTTVISTQTIIVYTPTTPTSLNTSNITGTSVDISWTAVDPGPFVVRYKKTSESIWIESSSTTTNTSLSSLDTGTEYEFQVKVDAPDPSCANYTSSTTFTTTTVNYCDTNINLNDSATDYISNVNIGDINQTTTNADSFYTYHTGVSTSLTAGGALSTGTITYQRQASSISQFVIWIDFNKNGIFDNTTEKIYENTTSGSATTTITENLSSISIPSSATTGATIMRIAMIINDSEIVSACDYFDSPGEVEDYDINIEPVDTSIAAEKLIITQIYHSGTDERWIEITNNSATEIATNSLKLALYQGKSGDQTGVTPDAEYTHSSTIAANSTVLIRKNTSAVVNHTGTPIEEANITGFDGGDDILIITSSSGSEAWANRFDVVSNIADETSYVRNDNISTYNNTYTSSEWTAFVDDNLDEYRDLASGGPERHPNAPLLSEISSSGINENIRLGVHLFESTTRTGSAWSNGNPDRSRSLIIDEDYEEASTTLKARSINVNGTNKLTITNQLLVINNELTINTGAEVRLSGTAQLIQTHTGNGLVSGTGKLYVDQNSTTDDVYKFNYFSSPVNSEGLTTFSLSDVMKDGSTPTSSSSTPLNINFINNSNDGATTSPITISENWIYTYANNTNGYIQRSATDNINQTDGFTLKGPGQAQNYTFVGTPKDGNITSISMGTDETYLIGNPYPSALNAKKFIEDNEAVIDGTLYFWEHIGTTNTHFSSSYTGGYATLTKDTGVPADNVIGSTTYQTPENYIPVGQGFFVTTSTNSGVINFNNSQREYVAKGATSVFFKTAALNTVGKTANTRNIDSEKAILKLGIEYTNNDGLSLHKQLGVVFNNNLTFDYDPGHDAISFNDGNADMYWKFSNDDNHYAITGVPEINNDMVIPLEIKTSNHGNLALDIDESQNIDKEAYLLDKETDQTQTLNNGKIDLELSPNTLYSDRFEITFAAKTLSNSSIQEHKSNITIQYLENENTITVSNYGDLIIHKLELYSLIGTKIAEISNNSIINLDKKEPSVGIYLLKITSDKGTISKKIIL